MNAPESALDPLAILAALGVGDVRRALPVTTGIGGTSLFRVERPGLVHALRVYRPGDYPAAERELAAIAAAGAGGAPVPAIEARGEWAGRPVALLEWRPGATVLAELSRRPWRAFALGRALGRVQARLHGAPVSEERQSLTLDWIGKFGEVDPQLREQLEAAAGREALLHLDFHPDNVLVHEGRVSAVVDWENALIGDPRADLARTWSLLRLAPMPPAARRPGVAAIRRLLALGWRRGYREAAGWPDDLALFQAWAAQAMIDDLTPKLGRPGIWLRSEDLEPVRRAAADLKARVGLPGETTRFGPE